MDFIKSIVAYLGILLISIGCQGHFALADCSFNEFPGQAILLGTFGEEDVEVGDTLVVLTPTDDTTILDIQLDFEYFDFNWNEVARTVEITLAKSFKDYILEECKDRPIGDACGTNEVMFVNCEDGGIRQFNLISTIEDINNQEPEFGNPSYAANIKLPWPGRVPLNEEPIVVQDRDYLLENADVKFTVNNSKVIADGRLLSDTTRPFTYHVNLFLENEDMQLEPNEVLQITANDGVNEASVTFTLITSSFNTRPPEFGSTFYTFSITEPFGIGDEFTPVGSKGEEGISAEDKDGDEDSIVTFSLGPDGVQDLVDVLPDGRVVFKVVPDHEYFANNPNRIAIIEIIAKEGATELESTSVLVVSFNVPEDATTTQAPDPETTTPCEPCGTTEASGTTAACPEPTPCPDPECPEPSTFPPEPCTTVAPPECTCPPPSSTPESCPSTPTDCDCPPTQPPTECSTSTGPSECNCPTTEEAPVTCTTVTEPSTTETCPTCSEPCTSTEPPVPCPTTCEPCDPCVTEPPIPCSTTCAPSEPCVTEPPTPCPTTCEPCDPCVTEPPIPCVTEPPEPCATTCAPCPGPDPCPTTCEPCPGPDPCPTTCEPGPEPCPTTCAPCPGPDPCPTTCEPGPEPCPTTCAPCPEPGDCPATESPGDEDCSNGGLIAGIIVTSILFVAAAGAAAFLWLKLRRAAPNPFKNVEVMSAEQELGGSSSKNARLSLAPSTTTSTAPLKPASEYGYPATDTAKYENVADSSAGYATVDNPSGYGTYASEPASLGASSVPVVQETPVLASGPPSVPAKIPKPDYALVGFKDTVEIINADEMADDYEDERL